MDLVQNVQSALRLVENEKMDLVQNVQSAFRLAENEKMGLVQNVQSAFRLVENENNICPLLDRQCMRKCNILFVDSWKMGIWKNGFYQNIKSHFLLPEK